MANEKDVQKREEKWRRDPLNAVVWAAMFIWAGVVLLLDNLGYLASLSAGFRFDIEAWSLIFLGAGVMVLIGVVVRLVVPDYRAPVTGGVIFALILIGIGLGDMISWVLVWPIILITLGLYIILRGLMRGR